VFKKLINIDRIVFYKQVDYLLIVFYYYYFEGVNF